MRRRLERWARVWRAWRVQSTPLPRVRAEIGPTVPGWVFLLVAGLLAGVTAGLGLALRGYWVAAGVVALVWFAWTALAPGVGSWASCVVAAGLVQLAVGAQASGLAAVLAVLAYATCRATWWAAHVPPRGRVSLRALGRAGRRDLAVLAVSAVVAGTAWWLRGSGWSGPAWALGLGVAGVVGLGVLVAALLRRASADVG